MTLVDNFLEITLTQDDDFLKIKETLTRIGVASKRDKKLFQSCHILHKQGKYYITHFKELFALDGKPADFTLEDVGRRNSIAALLEEWGLLKIVSPKNFESNRTPISHIKIIPFKDKNEWELVAKYTIGRSKS